MNLKRFSDFSNIENKLTEDKITTPEELKKIDLEEKTGDDQDEDENEDKKEKDKTPVEDEIDEKFEIEILEENIIKFNNGTVENIYNLLSKKYPNTDYFIRKKDNNLHVVKYNEKLDLNINNFVDSLFKFYSKNNLSICENIKIKGNDKFSLIENLKNKNMERVVNDLSKLLSKK